MTAEEELAAAVGGRAGWQLEQATAIYAPPGAAAQVRVRPVAAPTRTVRFAASILRSGRAEHTRPASTAVDAVRWAERVRLS